MATMAGFWISITDTLYSTYNTTQNSDILHDDGSTKWVRLRIPPNGVQRGSEALGETGTNRGVNIVQRRKPTKKSILELATPESRAALAKIMDALVDEEVTVRDYSEPLSPTEMTMFVNGVDYAGAIEDGTNGYYADGITISLEQV